MKYNLKEFDECQVPIKIYNKLNKKFGPFTLDPCSSNKNHKCEKYFTSEMDGLKQSWLGEFCFVHPPYSNIALWLEKSLREIHKSGSNNNTKSLFLIPARIETNWFHNIILPNAKEVYFLKGQIAGLPPMLVFVLEKKTPGINRKPEIKSFILTE